jgi:hypothetical protein
MLSGGALGSLFVGLATCYMWERGAPKFASTGPNSSYSPDIERVMAKVRNAMSCPCMHGHGVALGPPSCDAECTHTRLSACVAHPCHGSASQP